MYHISAQSYKVLTNVTFFILSFVTPCTSHTTFITIQNWSRSSFPTPMNTNDFIVLAILTCGGGGGGMGEDGCEAGGGVGGGGMRGILCLIKLISLLGEPF